MHVNEDMIDSFNECMSLKHGTWEYVFSMLLAGHKGTKGNPGDGVGIPPMGI